MTRVHRPALRGIVFAAAMSVAATVFAQGLITAVPPAAFRPPTTEKAAVATMLLPQATPALRITLPEPTAVERATLRDRNAPPGGQRNKATEQKGLAVAFPRDIPAGSQVVALSSLHWQALADGGRGARLAVVSPGAAALRVALAMPTSASGVVLRFSGNGLNAQTFGPIAATDVSADVVRFGAFWSPVLDGDTATIELHVPSGARIPDVSLTLSRISHQVVAPGSLAKLDAKAVQDIGTSGACNIDVACVTPRTQAFVDSTKAVAATEMTKEDGFTYLCTGTLLNDSLASNTPYLFSASHCIDSAMAARTLNTFWFFDAVACGSKTVPAFIQQASGAALLARSTDWDWALVRLNAAPPAGTHFSAWRAEPIPNGATISVIHHPQGDLTKWSQGTSQGYQVYTDGSSYALVTYSQGTTEPGSSGAGLLTFSDSGGFYEVRGGLWTGTASCSLLTGTDEYSRLDNMLPLTRQYLTPNTAGSSAQSVAVEFYNRGLDHHFITIAAQEIADLDAGVHPGWERTGLLFMAYNAPVAGASPVCRYYRTPGFGDSHFYSASVSECAAVTANPQQFPGWTLETSNAFYIALPNTTTGACAAGTVPVWRFFNQLTTNHRYTTDHTVRDDMRSDPATWLPEGYGPDSVIMCAPVGT